MSKFRLILLLSVAIMSSGYRWRCYAFCEEQTAVQNDYTEQRDECRGFAQDNIDAVMAKSPNPNSVKARKIKLIALFSDCMAQYGWDVPKVNEKGTKIVDNEVPLYTSTVSKLAASENNPEAETSATPNEQDAQITEKELPARKTPVGNVQKQQETETQKQDNTNNTNAAVQKSTSNNTESNKTQNSKIKSEKTQQGNIQKQPATSKSKKPANTDSTSINNEQDNKSAYDEQTKSSVKKTSSNTNSTTNKTIERTVTEQQEAQPVVVPPPPSENSSSYRRVVNNKNSAAQTAPNTTGYEEIPEAAVAEAPKAELTRNSANHTYTRTTNNISDTQASDSNRNLQRKETIKDTNSSATSTVQNSSTYNSSGSAAKTTSNQPANSASNPANTGATNNVNNAQTTIDNNSNVKKMGKLSPEAGQYDPAAAQDRINNPKPAYTKTTNSTTNSSQEKDVFKEANSAYNSMDASPTTNYTNPEFDRNNQNPTYASVTRGTNGTRVENTTTPATSSQTADNNMQQATLSANQAQATGSGNSEQVNRIITEKESIERVTNSQNNNSTSDIAKTTTAVVPPVAAAGAVAAGSNIDESAIPTQPRVTKNTPSKQRAAECEFARRSAGVSQAAAKKAKECDMECARQRKTMPETVTPAACPVKDPAVNVLDSQLENKR